MVWTIITDSAVKRGKWSSLDLIWKKPDRVYFSFIGVIFRIYERMRLHWVACLFRCEWVRVRGVCFYPMWTWSRSQLPFSRYEDKSGANGKTIPSTPRVTWMFKFHLDVKLVESIRKAFKDVQDLHAHIFWSDSTVALSWIKSVDIKSTNRVQEIRRLSDPKDWKYCLTEKTPCMLHCFKRRIDIGNW